jgi:hypothetical protein
MKTNLRFVFRRDRKKKGLPFAKLEIAETFGQLITLCYNRFKTKYLKLRYKRNKRKYNKVKKKWVKQRIKKLIHSMKFNHIKNKLYKRLRKRKRLRGSHINENKIGYLCLTRYKTNHMIYVVIDDLIKRSVTCGKFVKRNKLDKKMRRKTIIAKEIYSKFIWRYIKRSKFIVAKWRIIAHDRLYRIRVPLRLARFNYRRTKIRFLYAKKKYLEKINAYHDVIYQFFRQFVTKRIFEKFKGLNTFWYRSIDFDSEEIKWLLRGAIEKRNKILRRCKKNRYLLKPLKFESILAIVNRPYNGCKGEKHYK